MSTKHALTKRSSGSTATFCRSAVSVALAMAERRHFSTCSAARLFVNWRVASASPTFLPRIMSTTSRAFCADPRKYFAFAIASMTQSLNADPRIHHLPRRLAALLGLRAGVALEGAGGGELAELVADHVLGDVDRDVALAVVDAEGQADEVGRDGRAPRPRLDGRRPGRARADPLDRLQQV